MARLQCVTAQVSPWTLLRALVLNSRKYRSMSLGLATGLFSINSLSVYIQNVKHSRDDMNNESFFWGPVHPLDLSSSFIVYFGGLYGYYRITIGGQTFPAILSTSSYGFLRSNWFWRVCVCVVDRSYIQCMHDKKYR